MKKIRNLLLFSTLMVLTFGTGYNLGTQKKNIRPVSSAEILQNDKSTQKGLDFSLFWDVWDRLNTYYLDKEKLDAQNMIYGAISGMVASVDDPYTVFLTPDQNEDAKDDLGGIFEGIGAQLGVKDKKIVVIAPLKNSPAAQAGIEAGDWIVEVDGSETLKWTLPQAVGKIRGPKGSTVTLTIIHEYAEKPEDINVLRDEIEVPSVEWEILNVSCSSDNTEGESLCREVEGECLSCKKIAYLKLSRFGDKTNDEWSRAVSELIDAYARLNTSQKGGLILDVRNNPGGYLSGSVFIASEFLDSGIVVTQENADGTKKSYQVDRKGRLTDIPMAVLINKGSASASEIVAGSLAVRRDVPLIGEQSFGKGTIQEAQDLTEGAGIHITTAKWLLPDNSNISGEGLTPDIITQNDPENPEADVQLEKAMEALLL